MKEPKEDSLEQFMREHGEDFPTYTPSEGLWDKIDEGLDAAQASKAPEPTASKGKEIRIPVRVVWRAAAVLVVGFGLGYLFRGGGDTIDTNGIAMVDTTTTPDNPQEVVNNNYYVSLGDLAPDLKEVEDYYQTEIDQRMEELQSMNVSHDLMSEMQILTGEYEALQKEVVGNHNNARVIEAMIDNYKLRLDVLETILQEIRKGTEVEAPKVPQQAVNYAA